MYEKELTKLLQQILATDKTPDYEYYSENVEKTRFLNAKEEPPKTGHRWCTPREICREYIKDIEQGRLGKAFQLLMEDDA